MMKYLNKLTTAPAAHFPFRGVCPSANFFEQNPLKKVDLQVKRFPQEWKWAAIALYMCYNMCQIRQFELSSL
jgi:hypothetical protein